MDQQWKERIARSQARFRELNELFRDGLFTCECGDLGCTARIRVPREVYESVRADPRRFLVKPDHHQAETEDLILRREGWAIVRKRDDVAHIVEQRRPERFLRSPSLKARHPTTFR